MYLRLVHSVDYYNLCEYPAEDEMPHRCGLIHVRGPAPLGNITTTEGITSTIILLLRKAQALYYYYDFTQSLH